MEQTVQRKNISGTSHVILFIILLLLAFMVMAKDIQPTNNDQYKTVTVQKGDTLWALANLYQSEGSTNSFVDWVERVNHINRHHIEPGQKLIIPVKRS